MDLKARKLNMIEYLIRLNDEILFNRIERFIVSQEESEFQEGNDHGMDDFWDDLSPAQKEEIKKAFLEIEEGKAIDYESFIAKHR